MNDNDIIEAAFQISHNPNNSLASYNLLREWGREHTNDEETISRVIIDLLDIASSLPNVKYNYKRIEDTLEHLKYTLQVSRTYNDQEDTI